MVNCRWGPSNANGTYNTYTGYKDWEAGGKGSEAMPPYFPTIPGATDPFSGEYMCMNT